MRTAEFSITTTFWRLAVEAVFETAAGRCRGESDYLVRDRRHRRAFGRKVYRTPVGEANVVDMIQAVKAAIGGEGSSGGIIFPAVHLCRDSYSGMALFLHRMASTGLTISQLAGRLPRYYRKIGKVAYEHGRLGTLMLNLRTVSRTPDSIEPMD